MRLRDDLLDSVREEWTQPCLPREDGDKRMQPEKRKEAESYAIERGRKSDGNR